MVGTETFTARYDRRSLIKRLAAAGFAAPVIASIVADGAWAQDAATPVSGSPVAGSPVALPELPSPFTIIPPVDDPTKAFESVGVDQPLIAHGGFNFGTPPDLVTGFDVDNNAFF